MGQSPHGGFVLKLDDVVLVAVDVRSFAHQIGLGSAVDIFESLHSRVVPKFAFVWRELKNGDIGVVFAQREPNFPGFFPHGFQQRPVVRNDHGALHGRKLPGTLKRDRGVGIFADFVNP